MNDQLTNLEQERRNKLKNEKPLVYEKIIKYKDKIERGEPIPNIQLQWKYICSFQCQHCSVKSFQKMDFKTNITIEDIRKLMIEADFLGLANVIITGGESLIFPDLIPLIEAIDTSKFFCVLDTNGWKLNKRKAEQLKSLGIDKIQISIDSLDDKAHDDFRRKIGSFRRAVEGIDIVKNAGMLCNISTVMTKERVRSQEFIDYLEFAKLKDVDTFVSFAHPVGEWEGKFDSLLDNDDIAYIKELGKKYRAMTHLTDSYGFSLGCLAVKKMISIIPSGDVMPCPFMYLSLGNILKESLKDILDRGMKIKWFGEKQDTCLMSADRNFIDEYIVKKIYGQEIPVPWDKVFSEKDIIK